MKNFTGFLIKQQRLQRGLSQEGLCRGICAVSYLSKIEQGMGNPSPLILEQLLDKLQIHFNQNQDQLDQAKAMLDGYFDKYFHSETAEKETTYLKLHQREMENSELHLNWHLFNLFSLIQRHGKNAPVCHQELSYLARFTEYMETDQLFLYYVGAGLVDSEEQLEMLRLAETIRPLSFVKQSKAEVYYSRRDYMNAISAADRAYSAAAEEGSLPILLWSSYLLGACYANFNDLSFMLKYYKRARELSRGYDVSISSLIDSNIGTAYVEHGVFQEARPYLIASLEPKDQVSREQKLLACQKLALCCFEAGDMPGGLKYLQNAADQKSPSMSGIYDQLLYFTDLRYVQGDKVSGEYEGVLKELYQSNEETISEGYRRLFARWLVELYTAQRKYKDALAIQAENGYL